MVALETILDKLDLSQVPFVITTGLSDDELAVLSTMLFTLRGEARENRWQRNGRHDNLQRVPFQRVRRWNGTE